MMHLDPRTYAGLLAGSLPPEEALALAEHLAADCERCGRFLAERAEADALDGRGDAAIAGAFPPPAISGNDLEFARIQRGLRRRDPPRRRVAIPVAIAASVLIAGVAGLLAQRGGRPSLPAAEWDGVKGTEGSAVRVTLRAVRLGPAGEATEVRSGDSVDRGASLLFEVEADRSAEVLVARLTPQGGVEPLWRSRLVGGRTVLTTGGRPAAFPLAGLSGKQRFAVIAREGALEEAQGERAASALGRAGSEARDLAGVSFGVLELSVR